MIAVQFDKLSQSIQSFVRSSVSSAEAPKRLFLNSPTHYAHLFRADSLTHSIVSTPTSVCLCFPHAFRIRKGDALLLVDEWFRMRISFRRKATSQWIVEIPWAIVGKCAIRSILMLAIWVRWGKLCVVAFSDAYIRIRWRKPIHSTSERNVWICPMNVSGMRNGQYAVDIQFNNRATSKCWPRNFTSINCHLLTSVRKWSIAFFFFEFCA